MHTKGLLVAALVALTVGITGLLVVAPVTGDPVGRGGCGPGSMMGGRPFFGQGTSPDLPISPEQAQTLARQYLKNQGFRLDLKEPDRF